MCGENHGQVGTRFKRTGDNIEAETKTVRIFDEDTWRLAREASRLQNKSGESVGSAAKAPANVVELVQGNRCHLESSCECNPRKKGVSGHMVQENARDPWGCQFEAHDCEKLTRPGITHRYLTHRRHVARTRIVWRLLYTALHA